MGIYENLGVRPLVNATCHHTIYGGTVMWPEVTAAMVEARESCVQMSQLLDRASEMISRHTHADASHVVSGCAAGLEVGAAAILAGDDRDRIAALPDAAGFPRNEFIAKAFDRRRDADGREHLVWGWGHMVRNAGAVVVEVGGHGGDVTAEELERAFGPRTAGVYWLSDGVEEGLQLPEVIAIAHRRGVPVLVDASNTLPPAEHLHSFIDMGADLVAFSGGKGLRGPQGSGILTGRGDLIRAARLQSSPHGGIGRAMKVSKEEVVGLLTALEIWAARDHAADMRDARRRTDAVVEALRGVPGVRAEHKFPDHLGRPYPTVFVHIDPSTGLTGAQVVRQLLDGDPSVAVMSFSDPQIVRADVRILSDAEATLVASRLSEVLRAPVPV
jgi:D-glucosaminate-6-phosphate ammonia-lyase